jgi:hypothetical protein
VLLNFQGFQAELNTEGDFLLCSQAPEVFDDPIIVQAMKALHARPLHSHLVKEWLKTVPELYE